MVSVSAFAMSMDEVDALAEFMALLLLVPELLPETRDRVRFK